MTKVVIIGGDAAGMSAASKARRDDPSIEIVVFERGDFTSYAACGLPYLVGGLVDTAGSLIARAPEQHRANGIDVRMRHNVESIDVTARTVSVRALDDNTSVTESFDELVIATGASPIRPNLPGIDAKGVHAVHVIPDALAINEILNVRKPRHAVVVGSGYIGLEMAEALLMRGLHVTVLEMQDLPMATLDPDMGALVRDAMIREGVDLRLGVRLEAVLPDDQGWVTRVATSHGEIAAELVILGIGMQPNVQLAAEAGIEIGATGAIAASARMATSTPGVWTAGDCAESHHRVSNQPAWIALGSHANKHGRVLGTNLAGGDMTFPGVIGTAVTKVGSCEIGRTGLGEHAAAEAGFDAVATVTKGNLRANYYPGADDVTVKVIAERGTGRMLGAQIVGGADAAKRIDTFAVAIWNGMTAAEFSQLDLSYAPPFAPVWDTALIAARRVNEHT